MRCIKPFRLPEIVFAVLLQIVLMTASFTGLPRRDFITARNDTRFFNTA
ncbi:MAG: hypothetical protein IJV35_06895 [Neisseriaceae bacterium]|nr:hypothetical protein [Neisseriaceae bacterium]